MRHDNYYLVCYHPINIDQPCKPNSEKEENTMEIIEKRSAKSILEMGG